MEAKDYIKNF